MFEETTQSIGYICCDRQLTENLFLGHIEFPEGQQRQCVIQFLPNDGDELGRRRFTREAMLGLDLSRDHQDLVSVMHFGVWQDGRLFMVLDYFDGRAVSAVAGDISSAIDGQFKLIAGIARTVLRALDYLHSRGVVHGGVVAGNILLCADGRIRLGHFNEARRLTGSPELNTELKKADLRDLGILLFELLTGQLLTELVDASVTDGAGDGAEDNVVDCVSVLDHLPDDTPVELRLIVGKLFAGLDPMRRDEPLVVSVDDGRAANEPAEALRGAVATAGLQAGGPVEAIQATQATEMSGLSALAELADDQMEDYIAKLVTLASNMLEASQERLHAKLLESLATAEYTRPRNPGAPNGALAETWHNGWAARNPERGARFLGALAIVVAVISLVVAIFVSAQHDHPGDGAVVETRAARTAPETPKAPTESAPTVAVSPETRDEARPASVGASADSTDRSSQPGTRPSIKATPAVGAERVDGAGDVAGSRGVRDDEALNLDIATENVMLHRTVAIDRHQANTDGALLSVARGTLRDDGLLIMHARLNNDGQRTFHAAQFQARPTDQQGHPLVSLRFDWQRSSNCPANRRISPGARCRVDVWIEDPDILRTTM